MNAPPLLRRRFAEVDGRRVHFLRIGDGPPAVFVHSSPTNAWYVVPQMRELAHRFTCIAFDSPGFGLSDPLPGDELSVAQLADALADNMAAIGLPPCPVYGTHTGAAFALSLAARHPDRVTGLVLDGVPIFSAAEFDAWFDGYFEPLAVDPRGGHYARTWTRFRDQYIWFPWTTKTPDRHNEIDLGSPAAVHGWLMSYFHAARHYKAAYRAATGYGAQAIADAKAVRAPAIFTAVESDMLYPHLDRLPPLGPGQEIRRVGNDRARRDALIGELFERFPARAPSPADRVALAAGPGVRQQFVDLPDGQILVRHAGAQDRPALLLLHDAPGSGAALGGLIEQLADEHFVIAPDLPGCGGSDPPGGDAPALAAWADALALACESIGVARIVAYGVGIGASVALSLAERRPALVAALVLRGPPLPDRDERADLRSRYAPPIVPEPDGSHWYRTWLMLRDRRVYFPWYATRAANLRRVAADFDGDVLHDETFEVMKQHAAYHRVIDAAFDHDAAAALAKLRVPLALCHDPQVPFFAHDARLRTLCPAAAALPTAPDAHAAAVAAFVAAAGR